VRLPFTMGHEIAGEVVALGPHASSVKVGDKVVAYPWIGCGECAVCLKGEELLCLNPRSVSAVASAFRQWRTRDSNLRSSAYGKARGIWAGATRRRPEARDGERRSASDFPHTRSPQAGAGATGGLMGRREHRGRPRLPSRQRSRSLRRNRIYRPK
jgi:hypothetical protein